MDFSLLATDDQIAKTAAVLSENGISVDVVNTKVEAKNKVLSLIPKGSSVLTLTSVSLEETGLKTEIDESGNFDSVRARFKTADEKTKKQLGMAPDYALGSVHAVTEDGRVLIASNTGSQLGADAYGAEHVIWVVGTQKIVKSLDEGFERINSYILPKETLRSRKAYGLPDSWDSFPSKILLFQKEIVSGRVHVIFVKETLGF